MHRLFGHRLGRRLGRLIGRRVAMAAIILAAPLGILATQATPASALYFCTGPYYFYGGWNHYGAFWLGQQVEFAAYQDEPWPTTLWLYTYVGSWNGWYIPPPYASNIGAFGWAGLWGRSIFATQPYLQGFQLYAAGPGGQDFGAVWVDSNVC